MRYLKTFIYRKANIPKKEEEEDDTDFSHRSPGSARETARPFAIVAQTAGGGHV